MTQVVKGVLYLHSHGIIHRDLTLGNILLTKEMDAVSFNWAEWWYDTIPCQGFIMLSNGEILSLTDYPVDYKQ